MEKIKKYGKVGLATHLAISWSIFALTYLLISKTGQTMRIIRFLKLESRIPEKAGSFAISAIIYKAIMPGRIALSLLAIPVVYQKLNQPTPPLEPAPLTEGKPLLLSEAGLPSSIKFEEGRDN